jgi:predicted nucleotidyltransferase
VTPREISEEHKILLATVGSGAHGLALPGTDDHDEMGVCIEPPSHVIGLHLFEQDVFRSKPEGVRSEHGDTDRTIYSARKFCRLALNGNPSIITLLYAPERWANGWGESLIGLRQCFSARRAGKAFLGYMTQQRQRLLGERGQMNVKRPELVDAHGFDTKYAMHMLRLGYQGVEFLETGGLTLPMREEERAFVYATRKGEVPLNDVLTCAGELERRVEDLLTTSPLPEQPDYEKVNEWLIRTYLDYWGTRGYDLAALLEMLAK